MLISSCVCKRSGGQPQLRPHSSGTTYFVSVGWLVGFRPRRDLSRFWVLESELLASVVAANTLSCWAIFPAFDFLYIYISILRFWHPSWDLVFARQAFYWLSISATLKCSSLYGAACGLIIQLVFTITLVGQSLWEPHLANEEDQRG